MEASLFLAFGDKVISSQGAMMHMHTHTHTNTHTHTHTHSDNMLSQMSFLIRCRLQSVIISPAVHVMPADVILKAVNSLLLYLYALIYLYMKGKRVHTQTVSHWTVLELLSFI